MSISHAGYGNKDQVTVAKGKWANTGAGQATNTSAPKILCNLPSF